MVDCVEKVSEHPSLRYHHIVAAIIGNALEFYDFGIYGLFAIQIGRTFFPSNSAYTSLMLSLATFGAGFVTRPLGAVVIGAYSDRVGRRPAMMLSFVLMGSAIIGLAIIPSYASIGLAAPILAVAARMIMGFSLGGEMGPTTAFLLEAAPPHRRGLYVALQTASASIAIIFGGLVGATLSSLLSAAALDSHGWRVAFLIGAVSLPVGLWLRRDMPETLHNTQTETEIPRKSTDRLVVALESRRLITLGLIVLAYVTIANYVGRYTTTYAQNTLHFSGPVAFAASMVTGAVYLFGVLIAGWISDRIGRKPVMLGGSLISILFVYPCFYWTVTSHTATSLLVGMSLPSFGLSVALGGFMPALAEGLPKPIRGSAFAIVYAMSITIFGGTAQIAVTWLLQVTGNPMCPAWYLLLAALVGHCAMWMMPETAPFASTNASPLVRQV